MKNLILAATLLLAAATAFGQTLKKGNLVGVHSITVTLDPDVTMNQFKDFYLNKVIPEMQNHIDAKVYLTKSARGENANGFGFMWVFETEADRDKYFKPDGGTSELGAAAFQKMKVTTDELAKLGTWTSKYNDWVVQ